MFTAYFRAYGSAIRILSTILTVWRNLRFRNPVKIGAIVHILVYVMVAIIRRKDHLTVPYRNFKFLQSIVSVSGCH